MLICIWVVLPLKSLRKTTVTGFERKHCKRENTPRLWYHIRKGRLGDLCFHENLIKLKKKKLTRKKQHNWNERKNLQNSYGFVQFHLTDWMRLIFMFKKCFNYVINHYEQLSQAAKKSKQVSERLDCIEPKKSAAQQMTGRAGLFHLSLFHLKENLPVNRNVWPHLTYEDAGFHLLLFPFKTCIINWRSLLHNCIVLNRASSHLTAFPFQFFLTLNWCFPEVLQKPGELITSEVYLLPPQQICCAFHYSYSIHKSILTILQLRMFSSHHSWRVSTLNIR